MSELHSETDGPPFLPGTVAIVGAGPGRREYLTLLALDRIQGADVIFHDALVAREVLDEASSRCRVFDVGRRAGRGGPEASLTIARMIEEARRGQRVVRLHGGDPFVFGRGGEELLALEKASVRTEIVPGVSAVLAAPAALGIPLTLRGVARGFSVRTGHTEDGTRSLGRVDSDEETLVILMGLGGLRGILAGLVEEGRSPDLPAAIVSMACRPGERVLYGTIGTLADLVEQEGLESPATVIVGTVAGRTKRACGAASRVAA